jgi:PEP-CTERM motif
MSRRRGACFRGDLEILKNEGEKMKNLFWLVTMCFVAIVSMPLTASTATYDFTGDCFDCQGQGMATLVLQDYTLGDPLQDSNFVSFSYASNLLNVFSTSISGGNLTGMLPANLPGPADVTMNFVVTSSGDFQGLLFFFETANSPNDSLPNQWQIGEDDAGMNGIWSTPSTSPVPEPSTAPLAAMAVAGLAFWRFKNSRKAG